VLKAQRRTVRQRKNGNSKGAGRISTPIGYPAQGIIRPQRYSSWRTLPRLAAITPQYLESVLWGALGGFQVQQWELFDLMLDTWPELTACMQELTYGVERKKLIYEPYHEEDEQPSSSALERQDLCSKALRNMRPNPASDENDLRGTIKDLVDGWFRGNTVLEIFWDSDPDLGIYPRATQWVHPNNFAFGADNVLGLRQDSYGSTTSVQPQPANLTAFPPNKFLIGMHKAKSGPPLGCALLRPLAWWWCAANFSADWLLNLGQLFGIPWRVAYYDPNAPPETIAAIDNMLQNMGSSTWARFPVGTTIDIKEPSGRGSDHSPQGELLDRADRYARLLILGQTMTGTHGTTGKGGGQAFGVVERSIKEDRIDAAGKFAANIINGQLIKSICVLNYGSEDECPMIRFLEEEEGDLASVQRDKVLIDEGLPIGVDFMRKKYGVPEPAQDEELMKPAPKPSGFGGGGGAGGQGGGMDTPADVADEPQGGTGLETRLIDILQIRDEALFSRELGRFAEELNHAKGN
jgi:phage gp29-like protein